MKQARLVAVVLAGFWAGASNGVAQGEARSVGEIITAARLEAALAPIAEKTIPLFTLTPATPPGTYWMLQTDTPPLPFDPFPELMIYALGDNVWLVDDRSVDWPGLDAWLRAEARARRLLESSTWDGTTLMSLEGGGPPFPGEGGTNDPPAGGPPPEGWSYPSNAFWIEITAVSNAWAYLTLHGTEPDLAYEIQSRLALTNAGWASEGTVLGAAEQDWTATMVAVGERTNTLFFRARSWADTDGDGLPDWWELEHGLDPDEADTGDTGVSDGYKDGDADGWTNLQEYQNGTSPAGFNTPPAPQGLVVTLTNGGAHATLNWHPGSGTITGYRIERSFDSTVTQVSGSTASLADNQVTLPTGLYWTVPKYRLQATYSGGSSAWSSWTSAPESEWPEAVMRQGAGGHVWMLAAAIPAGAAALRVGEWDGFSQSITNVDLPVASFAGGVGLLPEPFASLTAQGYWYAQWVSSNQAVSAYVPVGWYSTIPFWDGRGQLKQNLIFLLRAATPYATFGYWYDDGVEATYFIGSPAHYAYAGLYETYEYAGSPVAYLAEFRPFAENFCYRNFVFAPTDLRGDGWLTTGAEWDASHGLTLYYPMTYEFQPPPAVTNIPALLSWSQARWPVWQEFVPRSDYMTGEIGIGYQGGNFTMTAGARNVFGLPYLSAELAWGSNANERATLVTGGSIPGGGGYFYPETAQPGFQTEGYYFGAQDEAILFNPHLDPLPGHAGFSPANPPPLLLTSVGNPWYQVAGYAKLAITNGYADKFGYLGQYFDAAYQIDDNGVVTTNETGILSPYGEFFPTEPGPTALVTMPDLDTNERGTAVVHVVSLNVDANHDGVMDLSWTGPDNTSEPRPFVFWVNNDYDRFHDFYEPDWNQVHDQEEDDLKTAGSPGTVGITPDCDYQWTDWAYAIPSKRDLEDYTRLWIPGMKQLYETHTNLIFELSIRNNDTADGPAINLVLAAESDGGTRYLTNTAAADDQISLPSGKCIGRIGPSSTIRLNDFFNLALYPGTGAEHFIWCGAKRGKGELVLQVKDGTNLLAETSLWLELKDIKEMYERWTVGDIGSKPPTNTAYRAVEDLPSGVSAFQYGLPGTTNTSYILHLHGWNMNTFEKDRYAETVFKRLYWQGYQGRFGSFRWPTKTGFTTFDTSEFQAWKSGVGLYRLLTNLNATYPGRVYLTAHSMGNIVAAEALRMAGSNPIVNTYIAMQAAIASHAYDPSTTNRSMGIFDSNTPDRHAAYWTNGAPCYMSGIQGAAHFANFYNRRDWALDWWETDQNTKPDYGYSWVYVPNEEERYYYTDAFNNVRSLHFPQDTFEIFSFITEARCYALGQQVNVGGAFNPLAQVNLDAPPHSFGELHKGHSGEFRSTNMERWPFWEQVLFTMGLKAAQ